MLTIRVTECRRIDASMAPREYTQFPSRKGCIASNGLCIIAACTGGGRYCRARKNEQT